MAFPSIELELIGLRKRVPLEAFLDTGFEGHLCVPIEVAVEAGLELVAEANVTLADGYRLRQMVFGGRVNFLGKEQAVEVFVFDRNETLIGTKLLADCQLVLDFPTRTINLFRTQRTNQ